jgi:hypothetical protein
MSKTIFVDIDGTLIKHQGQLDLVLHKPKRLPYVIEAFRQWKFNNYCIVVTSSRPESMRVKTEEQLESIGLFWDIMILGLPHGERIVINDVKPGMDITYNPSAIGITLPRDEGLADVVQI